ncbi:MAG: hypothetical protein V3T58_06945 [Candidatus Hydrothermarchaeales archaeon]
MNWNMLLLIAGMLLISGCIGQSGESKIEQVSTPAPTSIDAKPILEKKCSVCHSLDRIRSKRKTYSGWETTVKRMLDVKGARERAGITDEEAKTIIEYLATTYPSE